MLFERVILLPECLSVIRAESHKTRGIETGGPLVGYVDTGGTLVVANAAGPGPASTLERYSVTIDGKHAQEFCDQSLRESNGCTDYIGDWHKHTGLSLTPSRQDVIAMKTMAYFEFSPTKQPISLIYRSWPMAWQIYVWDGSGSLAKMPSKLARRKIN
jgi:integrative and conjugative element protein (TIGR02256 family)